jgi:hypothetical protein
LTIRQFYLCMIASRSPFTLIQIKHLDTGRIGSMRSASENPDLFHGNLNPA